MQRAIAVSLILAISTPALADDLDAARAAEAQLDYDKALAIVEGLLRSGAATTPDRFVELQLYAGTLAAGTGRIPVAEDHFARAIAVKPNLTLPDGTSPKLTEPLEAARARTPPLRLSVIATDGAISLLVDADAVGLVRGIELVVTDTAGTRRTLTERGAQRLAVPKGMTAIEVSVLDAQGNRVWRGVPPAERTILPPPRLVTEDDRPGVMARWETWTVVTGVVLGAGAFSAWRFKVAQNDWDAMRARPEMFDYSALHAVEDRGRRWGLTANIAFGVAAATGITAFVLYYRHRNSRVLVSATGIGGEF